MWRKSHKFNFQDEPLRTSKTSKQPSKQFLEHAGDTSDASLGTIDVFAFSSVPLTALMKHLSAVNTVK